jgi:hypothetical protein
MQDLIVTGIAAVAALVIGRRFWRSRKRTEPACANCVSNTKKPAPPTADAPKPVLFYGSKR